jgi:poly(3-hydroxybutyrate) depolymerase
LPWVKKGGNCPGFAPRNCPTPAFARASLHGEVWLARPNVLIGGNMRPASSLLFSSCVGLVLFAFACSSSTNNTPAPAAAAPDAGVPTSPEDVPAVAIEANADTDCPGAYKTTAPRAGQNNQFAVDGQQRSFWIIEPEGAGDGPVPVFIALNGTGENGQNFSEEAAQLTDFAKRGVLIVAPSSIGNGELWPVWDSLRPEGTENNPNKDIDYVDQLLKCVAAHRPVDKNRVFVGGHSAGGIFTNNLIQRRSEVFAGAIVASGIFSQTSPDPAPDMDKMLVLVTWGGDNDKYTGKAGSVDVENFSFVPEASKASQYYGTQRNVGQANCHGNNVGHDWLRDLNDWMLDLLLAHPKGLPGNEDLELPPVPASSKSKCTTTPYAFTPTVEVDCPTSTTTGCQEACQIFGDCAVANDTVSGVLGAQLKQAGFSGTNLAQCGGCVSRCEQKAIEADDTEVLTCMKDQETQNGSRCGQGIDGAFPLIDALNTCCKGKANSGYCKDMCGIINTNAAAANYFKVCADF